MNPIFSFKNGLPGMACMGVGYDNGLLPGINSTEDDNLPF
ncbi:hypothetical protein LEP1GSC008_0605 [Leptospira kirschneri serovar Bulgarica str. Nikolaevo]|uniref:Uncharacterized protein n=1 Tax=Leptospira kirschneri serovar Bulgarica str. Nikolaevo TaxID=1240687 RepID=M6F5X5_9LEPT|nr:hypothetical protein LEP1GSC008_1552 [Leptospira kirschneri serovar Bulgarica str. Nikolaevo]EMK24547.1 hypothetical protein LEP1GSC008_2625 [Leptospira kirschneri serovar Bulgarica str. Nikolaevo]EMK24898.1 hypothetical protein LEP1GSC008_0605 [Leptospira kirschneri serovar Bulgarica str. Nikolaevo]